LNANAREKGEPWQLKNRTRRHQPGGGEGGELTAGTMTGAWGHPRGGQPCHGGAAKPSHADSAAAAPSPPSVTLRQGRAHQLLRDVPSEAGTVDLRG